MKTTKHLLLIAFLLCLTATIKAAEQSIPDNEIHYTSTDGNIVTPYKTDGFGANIISNIYENGQGVITFDGPVTKIGAEAFLYCPLTSIYLPESVTNLETHAFSMCRSLTNILLPNNLTNIERYAFFCCDSIISIHIPNSVKIIEEYAFCACRSLASITIPYSVTHIGEGVFQSMSSLSSIIVDKANTIYDSRNNCNAIVETATNTLIAGCSKTTIPQSVTNIGTEAFYGCDSLTAIIIPNSIISIGTSAFYECSSLQSITLPNSVTSFGYNVFNSCPSLSSIIVDETNTIYDSRNDCNAIIETATNTLLAGCQNTRIPNSVTTINSNAFSGCTTLESIIIPEGVTTIGFSAFWNCSSLSSVVISNSVTTIKSNAFEKCSSLKSVAIPMSVTKLEENVFKSCSSLSSIIVDKSNTIYDSRNDCNAIISTATNTLIAGCRNTIIPHSVTTIGPSAFSGCSSLTSITIPESVNRIMHSAFHCDSLDTIYIKAMIPPYIDMIAFTSSPICHIPCGTLEAYETAWINQISFFVEDCEEEPTPETHLIRYTSTDGNIVTPYDTTAFGANIISNTYENGEGIITFDGPVTQIGDNAFYNCETLSSIEFGKNLKTIGQSAFYSTDLRSAIFHEGLDSIGKSAFAFCNRLKIVSIPSSVRHIYSNSSDAYYNSYSFSECNSIDSIYWNAHNCPDVPFISSENANVRVVVFGDSITRIPNDFCKNFANLLNIILPDTLGIIGEKAFYQCTKLSNIDFGRNLKIIEKYAFYSCDNLRSITFPEKLDSIAADAFYSCDSLRVVSVPYSVRYIEPTSGNQGAFQYCNAIDSIYWNANNCTTSPFQKSLSSDLLGTTVRVVVFGDSITHINDQFCKGFKNLSKVIFPMNLNSIGSNAFYGCEKLTSLTFPHTVTDINESAFSNCKGLQSINSWGNVKVIRESAFQSCISLRSVILPIGIDSIESRAFYNCDSLRVVSIPSSINFIEDGWNMEAFYGCHSIDSIYWNAHNCNNRAFKFENEAGNEMCTNLRVIVFGDSITHINDQFCKGFKNLSKVIFPMNLNSIGSNAFYGCEKLTSLTFPHTVTDINESAFSNCSSLTTLYANPLTPPSLGSSAFANTSLNEIYVPCGSTNAYKSSAWNTYCTNFIEPEVLYTVSLHSADTTQGQVAFDQDPSCDNTAIIRAIPSSGYRFTTWNDGVTTNPRTLLLSQDTTFTANFELMLLDAEYATICYGESYTWDKNGQTYIEAGTYTTITGEGEVTLYLTILPEVPITNDSATICYGETYTWNSQTYSTEGEYSITLTNALGCDSVATLHLTIMPEAVTTTETVVIGSDELPYTWRGNTYSATGRYTVVEQYTTVACDSAIHVLDLTVLTTGNHDEQSATICETDAPYTWYGEYYSATGKYTYTEKYAGTDIDSIQHILNLTVNPTVYTEEHITACDSYEWNSETYTQSGDYAYTTTASNGCDSIVTLHLSINQTQYAEETVFACDSYVWNGETYTQSGDYIYNTTATNGCDSIVTLHLTINNSEIGAPEFATICYGETYTWNGQTYLTEGEYSIVLSTINGCDSIATLHLTINPIQYADEYITACDSYEWNGQTYTQSGEYVYTTVAANGCDSIVTLHLTISPTLTAEETITACDSYEWNGQTYTQSGEYVYTTVAANGCDSIVTLHLTINNSEIGATEYVTICYGETYTWNGQTYSTEGEYSIVLSTINGCDSIAILHLTINPIQYADEYITACDSYEWNGQIYAQSGEYTYTTVAANGCDSIVTLHLTINQSEVGATEYATICYGETYTWNGQTYSTEGEYSITLSNTLGCDSVATLELTILPEAVITEESATINEEYLPYIWRGQSYYATGTYTITEPFANYAYCDSAVHLLHLTVEAPNKSGDNLYWHYSNNTLTITGSGDMYDDPDLLSYRTQEWYPARVNNIILPKALTHIGNVAFADCSNLTNIVIPNSVTSIGDGAFSWTGLQSVTIPASVTELGEQVFEACSNLHTIIYEGYPTVISNQAIHPLIGCVHLDTVIAPAALWHCTNADKTLEIRYGVPHKARYIEVTDGLLTNQAVKYIAQNATALEVLDLTNTTNTTLPYGAFSHSYLLTQLYLPAYIETLPESMIEGGNRLMEITIPATVTEIGNYAFAGCVNIWRMTVEATTPPKVYENTFDGISRSISVLVPAGSEQAYREAEYWREFFIDNTNSPLPTSNCQKILREDHIYILRDGRIYTIMGAKIK